MDTDQAHQPLISRRKRRASSQLGSPRGLNVDTSQTQSERPSSLQKEHTPCKTKKRVRFSDPGPGECDELATTGLTPFLRRTAMQDHPSPPPEATLRRQRRASTSDLKNITVSDGSNCASCSPASGDLQFLPLRQIIAGRVKRRLVRNYLSEELNHIESERKSVQRQQAEIRRLRNELSTARTQASENAEAATRIVELENEILSMKEDLSTQHDLADPDLPTPEHSSPCMQSPILFGSGRVEDALLLGTPPRTPNSPSPVPHHRGDLPSTPQYNNILLEEHITQQTGFLISARLELERLCPGETTLGLEPHAGNVQPVLAAFLDRLRHAQAGLASASASLETLQTQEINLRTQFNQTLHTLERVRCGADRQAAARAQAERAFTRTLEERDRSISKLGSALNSYRAEVASLEKLITRLESEHAAKLAKAQAETSNAVASLEAQLAKAKEKIQHERNHSKTQLLHGQELEERVRELQAVIAEKQALVRSLESERETLRTAHASELGALHARVAALAADLDAVRDSLSRSDANRRTLAQAVEQERTRSLQLAEAIESERNESERVRTELRGFVQDWDDVAAARRQSSGGDALVLAPMGLITPCVTGGRFRDIPSNDLLDDASKKNRQLASEKVSANFPSESHLDEADSEFRKGAADSLPGTVEMQRGRPAKRAARRRQVDSGIGLIEEESMPLVE